LEPLKAVGGVTLVLNADLGGQKPTLAEQIGVCQRFCQRISAFQNTELSNSMSPRAEPGLPIEFPEHAFSPATKPEYRISNVEPQKFRPAFEIHHLLFNIVRFQ
jgi:hypothetical protein